MVSSRTTFYQRRVRGYDIKKIKQEPDSPVISNEVLALFFRALSLRIVGVDGDGDLANPVLNEIDPRFRRSIVYYWSRWPDSNRRSRGSLKLTRSRSKQSTGLFCRRFAPSLEPFGL